MEEPMLTLQSQKADYYHPGGDGWETTRQISFSLVTRERTRVRKTICVIVLRAGECRPALVTSSSPSLWLRDCSFSCGGSSCEAVTKRRGYRPAWPRASCCWSLCRH